MVLILERSVSLEPILPSMGNSPFPLCPVLVRGWTFFDWGELFLNNMSGTRPEFTFRVRPMAVSVRIVRVRGLQPVSLEILFMCNDYFPASHTVNAQPDVLYETLSLAELRAIDHGRLERVIDMLNRAWDISPRLSIASFELAFTDREPDAPVTVALQMRGYFRTLSKLIQRSRAEYGERNIGHGSTRLWGIWSADKPGRGANSRIRVACLLDRDVCIRWQAPGATWQSVIATTFHTAYRVVHGNRPEMPALGVQLRADWLQSVDGYRDFAGFKAAFRQLIELCKSPDCAFGCGLVPDRLSDVELCPLDSFIFPPDSACGESKGVCLAFV